MIFVTVGTHEQQFNRLIEYVDNLKKEKIIEDEVIMQIGYSTYEPKYCKWQKLYPYHEMIKLVNEARIEITHGGPSSFIMPLQVGKTPIVVPRMFKFDEHVNDHQVEFAKAVEDRMKSIITITEIEKLGNVIMNYDAIKVRYNCFSSSNNLNFCNHLENIVDSIIE